MIMSFLCSEKIFSYIIVAVALLCMAACASDDEDEVVIVEPVHQTVVMFFPWSTNLKSAFQRNVQDFSDMIARRGLKGERVVVCMATTSTDAALFELKVKKGKCVADTLRRYKNRTFTSASSMASLFSDIKTMAPAERYGLIVGSHGMAWLPVDNGRQSRRMVKHYDVGGPLSTRYFGGLTTDTQIETSALAQALADTDLKMEYILFDDCYMSSVEVAYEMKSVAHYIIACPTEIMSYGFPYGRCGEYLLGSLDYRNVVDNFIGYYSFSSSPYATAAVTDCTQLDDLADIVRQINEGVGEKSVSLTDVQPMDGYEPSLFFDFGDYIRHKCEDALLLEAFNAQLDKVVPYKGNTEYYYSALCGKVRIDRYSGLNTSESSLNTLFQGYDNTAWYKATHCKQSIK